MEVIPKKVYKNPRTAKLMERIVCECGATSYRCNLSHHRKSEKHTKLLERKKATSAFEKEKFLKGYEMIKRFADENNIAELFNVKST